MSAPEEEHAGLVDMMGHESDRTLTRHRRPLVRLQRQALGLALAVVITPVCSSAKDVAAMPTGAFAESQSAAIAAQSEAEKLMGGRPFQMVLMDGQRVLMSTSSPGSSLVTPVPLASISKAVTAMVVMRLVEEGLLRLDQTLGEILAPEMIPESWAPVTIEQLLSHQSGFGDDRNRWFDSSYQNCYETFVSIVRRSDRPRSRAYQYSNTNFCALSLAIISVTGVAYEEATFRYVFRPLGIARQQMNDEYVNLLGAGGWEISALTTARLISALDPRASISPLSVASRRLMIQRSTYNYGLGVWIWDENTFGHSGTLYRARNIAVRLASGRVVVILTQATFPESGLELLSTAQRVDQIFGSSCSPMNCKVVGPDPFLGDSHHLLRQTYF